MLLAGVGAAVLIGWPEVPPSPNAVPQVDAPQIQRGEQPQDDDELSRTSTQSTAPHNRPWASVSALGYVPVGSCQSVDVKHGEPTIVHRWLTPDPRGCSGRSEGRCTAGCFEVMAASQDMSLGPLSIEVTPSDDPSDIIAASLSPGDTAAAGFCYDFKLGHGGHKAIAVRVLPAHGEGTVEVTAWRHPDPETNDTLPTIDLRLPTPGRARNEILAEVPACAENLDEQQASCRFHGPVGSLPLSKTCEDGCTWWTYRFEADRLATASLERSVADVDAEFFAQFADEAMMLATSLDQRYGHTPPEDLAQWMDVETDEHRETLLVLQRRMWPTGKTLTKWELGGTPGHHAVASLRISVSSADELVSPSLPEDTSFAHDPAFENGTQAVPFTVPTQPVPNCEVSESSSLRR